MDFRNTHKDAKVLKEYGGDPIECARVLAKLVGLGKCKVVEDWRKVSCGQECLAMRSDGGLGIEGRVVLNFVI